MSVVEHCSLLLPGSGVSLPSAPQSYGPLMMGGASEARSFTFRTDGACGESITARLSLNDDGANLGSVAFTIPPIASVGLSEPDARARTRNLKVRHESGSDWYTARQAAEAVCHRIQCCRSVRQDDEPDLIAGNAGRFLADEAAELDGASEGQGLVRELRSS